MFESIEGLNPLCSLWMTKRSTSNPSSDFQGRLPDLIATDGPRAIDLCHTGKPDLILLDVVIPDMDGYAVARPLKSNGPPPMYPSSLSRDMQPAEEECKCLEAGAVDFISSQSTPVVVRSRVRTHLTKQTDQYGLAQMVGLRSTAGETVGSWTLELASE